MFAEESVRENGCCLMNNNEVLSQSISSFFWVRSTCRGLPHHFWILPLRSKFFPSTICFATLTTPLPTEL
jgi:hypothetical protein